MSVHGEFQRVLADLVTFLRASEDPACAGVAARLQDCEALARDDLNAAARAAVALCATAPSPDLPPLQRDEFEARAEHLTAICRALLP